MIKILCALFVACACAVYAAKFDIREWRWVYSVKNDRCDAVDKPGANVLAFSMSQGCTVAGYRHAGRVLVLRCNIPEFHSVTKMYFTKNFETCYKYLMRKKITL